MNPTKLRTLVNAQPRLPFFRKLNVWDIRDNVVVGLDLQMSAVLRLSDLPDILLKGQDEVASNNGALLRFIHGLPENITLQFVVQARAGDPAHINEFVNYKRDLSNAELCQMILESKKEYLSNKFIQKREYYLYVTTYKGILDKIPSTRLTSIINEDVHTSTKSLHAERVAALNSVTSAVIDSLRGMKIKARRLGNEELVQYFFTYLNPSTSQVIPAPSLSMAEKRGLSIRSLLAQTASRQEDDHFVMGGYNYKGVNLLMLPEALNVGSLHNMTVDLWPDYDLSVTVHVVNSESLISRLKSAATLTRGLSATNFGSRYEATQKYQELEELITTIRGSSQKLFTMSFAVVFRDRDLARVEQNAADGLKGFQELGSAGGVVDDLNHEDLYLACLPNHSHFNSRKHVMHSEPLVHLLPLSDPWTGTPEAKMLFENPQGELVNLDMFDGSLPAKHALVIGTTGSGKSFTTNYILTNFFIESALNHIIIIDVGGSYRKLCQLFDGSYFDVELSEEYGFNPFPDKGKIFDGKEFDPDDLAYLILIMLPMVLDQDEAMNNSGETLLEKSIKAAYTALGEHEAPVLSDVARVLQRTEGDTETVELARHYYKNLEMWTEGRYSKVFNNRRRLEVNNRLIVFDLDRLSAHPKLQSVYFYVIREIIDAKLRDKSLRKMIVVDEGWRFFSDEIGSKLIDNLYRTARKSNGMVLSISQSPEDFIKTKAASGIITNSYQKYILKLNKGHEFLPQFGFTEAQIEAVKNLTSLPRRYSDVFLKFNEAATVLRLEPSTLDYWICTTDAQDSLREAEVRREHPDWTSAQVLAELARRYGNTKGGS